MARDILQIALTILAIFVGWKIGEKIVTPNKNVIY
jgi:hypothetical protein